MTASPTRGQIKWPRVIRHYRNQKTLHLVFAISSVAMLATTVWMFWDDYNRPYKNEQRVFRDVEEELAKRSILAAAPTKSSGKAVLEGRGKRGPRPGRSEGRSRPGRRARFAGSRPTRSRPSRSSPTSRRPTIRSPAFTTSRSSTAVRTAPRPSDSGPRWTASGDRMDELKRDIEVRQAADRTKPTTRRTRSRSAARKCPITPG